MKETPHTEKFMGEEQLQDISGGCSGCDLLRQARDGFRAAEIRHDSIASDRRLSGYHVEAQMAIKQAENNHKRVKIINDALTQIKH